jgi:hypothetical protein
MEVLWRVMMVFSRSIPATARAPASNMAVVSFPSGSSMEWCPICFTAPTGPYRERRGNRARMKVVFPEPEIPATGMTFTGCLSENYSCEKR